MFVLLFSYNNCIVYLYMLDKLRFFWASKAYVICHTSVEKWVDTNFEHKILSICIWVIPAFFLKIKKSVYLIINLRFLATSTIYHMHYFEHLNHSKLNSEIFDNFMVLFWVPQPYLPMRFKNAGNANYNVSKGTVCTIATVCYETISRLRCVS